jgi:hypothetical protein
MQRYTTDSTDKILELLAIGFYGTQQKYFGENKVGFQGFVNFDRGMGASIIVTCNEDLINALLEVKLIGKTRISKKKNGLVKYQVVITQSGRDLVKFTPEMLEKHANFYFGTEGKTGIDKIANFRGITSEELITQWESGDFSFRKFASDWCKANQKNT